MTDDDKSTQRRRRRKRRPGPASEATARRAEGGDRAPPRADERERPRSQTAADGRPAPNDRPALDDNRKRRRRRKRRDLSHSGPAAIATVPAAARGGAAEDDEDDEDDEDEPSGTGERARRRSQGLPRASLDALDAGWDDDLADATSVFPEPTSATAVAEATASPPLAVITDAHDEADEADDPIPDQPWGDDRDAPTPGIALAADLPANPGEDDPDPTTAYLADDHDQPPVARVRNVVGVKFQPAGRIYEFDAGDDSYARGDEVVVETERGTRVGVVAIASSRRPHEHDDLQRVVRRATARDRGLTASNEASAREALAVAKQRARALRLPIKVFRAEYTLGGTKLQIYFSAEGRVDFRQLLRELSQRLPGRVELRQTGVRDEAKLVGGIGSCGRELCCSTFLPSFAPVSIKMAKDQGLVLNPTKVSGQCGRLKCCLVYEQDTYAAMRKGLPKLGKRVLTDDDREGRVVEVDVLRQRIRVAFGYGEFETFPAGRVRAMFPPQTQGKPS